MSSQISSNFVHCHRCLTQDLSEENIFCLTQCQKVFCSLCLKNSIYLTIHSIHSFIVLCILLSNQLSEQMDGCLSCGSNECQICPLVEDIPEEIKINFKDTTLWMKHIFRAVVFQSSQQSHLIRALKDKV